MQAANEKLLQAALGELLDTVSLDADDLKPLRVSTLDSHDGTKAIEHCLVSLYRALEKVDPSAINSGMNSKMKSEASSQGMRIYQERQTLYLEEANAFCQRLQSYSRVAFDNAFSDIHSGGPNAYDLARAKLWKYSPMMLFTKELNFKCWEDIIRNYQARAGEIYASEVDRIIDTSKKKTVDISTDDNFALFTTQEKETETFASAARKMTVKRSATLAKTLRNTSHKDQTGYVRRPLALTSDCTPHEAFADVLHAIVPTICAEQNFMTDFFHATTFENGGFLDVVSVERSRGTDLYSRRYPETGGTKSMSTKVQSMTKVVFNKWFFESANLVTWAVNQDELYADLRRLPVRTKC